MRTSGVSASQDDHAMTGVVAGDVNSLSGSTRENNRSRVLIGRTFAAVSVILSVGGVATLAAVGGWDFLVDSLAFNFGTLGLMFGVLTWVMIPSQSRNGSVWALAWAGLFAALFVSGVAGAVAVSHFPGMSYEEFNSMSIAELPGFASFLITARFWAVVPALWLPLTVGLLMFPTGRPPSRRWRWVGWWSLTAIAVGTVATAIVQNPWSTLPIASGEDTVPTTGGAFIDAGFGLAALSAVVCVASLFVRYRRSEGTTRTQIRSIALGGAIYTVALVLGGNLSLPPVISLIGGVLAASALAGAYGIAIMRYRLYDIDVVISKTITFGVLAAFITGVYALLVVGIGSVLGGGDEPSLALSIAAVAIVAVVFEPLRRRVQHFANRLVYGQRATPYEVLSGATGRLSTASDPRHALQEVTRLVEAGTGAEQVVVWMAIGDSLVPHAATPESALSELHPVQRDIGDVGGQIPGDYCAMVRHRGEMLGALTITKARGDSVTGADVRVLEDVAAGAGGLLRNIALNVDLVERAELLRLSRRRLVAAQDAERHRLERDLHDGAQQQVVALKVKLGIARTLAEREGAAQVAELVDSIADTTQQAVDSMRLVAHGIYPPLLEAEGLEAALAAFRRTMPIPVEVDANGIGRHSRQVDESVYFAVVGTLTRMADLGASQAVVELSESEAGVRFLIESDVLPEDLTAVQDRTEAVGGTVEAISTIGGWLVRCEIPTTARHLEPA